MAAERTRSSSRRAQIVAVAMRHFADQGYRGARIEDIASEVGVAKGTVFLHFGSKEGLFLATYEEAVRQLPAWLDAPPEVL
jgi:AcrR family transcriptional regulator